MSLKLTFLLMCTIYLMVQWSDGKYSGPDSSFYVPLQRYVIKGLAQQLLSFQNKALVHGVYAFNTDCTQYTWNSYYGAPQKKSVNCSNVAETIYMFRDLKNCSMNAVAPVTKEEMPYPSYIKNLYLRTRCSAPYGPVQSHMTVSAGPGWYMVRFPVEEIFMYTQMFRLNYRKIGDKKWIKTAWPTTVVFRKGAPRTRPNVPCPPWPDYSMFCLLITDFVRMNDESHQEFEGEIQTAGIIPEKPKNEQDFSIKTYKFIFRVHFCDVTVKDDCPNLKDFKYDPDFRPPVMSESQFREKEKEIEHGVDKSKERKESALIFFILLALIIPPLLFLIVFFIVARRAEERARHNWYHISSVDWPVHYTLRLPPDLQRQGEASGPAGEPTDKSKTFARLNVVSQRPNTNV